jgi:hypothetical protein
MIMYIYVYVEWTHNTQPTLRAIFEDWAGKSSNPTLRTIFEDWAGKSSRSRKSPQAPHSRRELRLPLKAQTSLNPKFDSPHR